MFIKAKYTIHQDNKEYRRDARDYRWYVDKQTFISISSQLNKHFRFEKQEHDIEFEDRYQLELSVVTKQQWDDFKNEMSKTFEEMPLRTASRILTLISNLEKENNIPIYEQANSNSDQKESV